MCDRALSFAARPRSDSKTGRFKGTVCEGKHKLLQLVQDPTNRSTGGQATPMWTDTCHASGVEIVTDEFQDAMIHTLIAAIATMLLVAALPFPRFGRARLFPGITSPLGITTALPVTSAGIPLGTTELASPGLSSAP